jgi:hypothetical protein
MIYIINQMRFVITNLLNAAYFNSHIFFSNVMFDISRNFPAYEIKIVTIIIVASNCVY